MTQRLSLMQRFGRLRVLIPKGRVRKLDGTYRRDTAALCICDCGKWISVVPYRLRNGTTKSCGCFSSSQTVARNQKHGKKGTPEYNSWKGARQRCNNPNNKDYANYGGRGIKVHPAWNDFRQFLSDMGQKPSPELTLERVDVNSDYCRENCIWATGGEQANNKRTNVYVLLDGKRITFTQAARKLKFDHSTAQYRRHRGWPAELWFFPTAEVQLVT